MSNELFVELNDEQQEIIAGGASLDSASITAFKQQIVAGGTVSSSGPGGSFTASNGAAQNTETFGLSVLAINA
jgi:hypothetical protein